MARMRWIWIVSLLALPLAASAGDEEQPGEQLLEQIVKELRRAFSEGNYTATTNVCARIEKLRGKYEGRSLEPLVKALAKGVTHRDVSIAAVTVKTMGKIAVPGSSRYLTKLLSPPRKVPQGRWNLYLAAIEAAGAIHDERTVPKLDQLLNHTKTDFAVAAAKALASYTEAKSKTRVDVVRRLATTLGRIEKKRPKTQMARVHVSVVKSALVNCLRTLTKEPKLATAADARAWLLKAREASGS